MRAILPGRACGRRTECLQRQRNNRWRLGCAKVLWQRTNAAEGPRFCHEEEDDVDEEDGADDELESEEEDELVFDESASATSAPSLGRLAIRAASPPMPGASWSCPSCVSSSASVKTKSGGGGKLFLFAVRRLKEMVPMISGATPRGPVCVKTKGHGHTMSSLSPRLARESRPPRGSFASCSP